MYLCTTMDIRTKYGIGDIVWYIGKKGECKRLIISHIRLNFGYTFEQFIANGTYLNVKYRSAANAPWIEEDNIYPSYQECKNATKHEVFRKK